MKQDDQLQVLSAAPARGTAAGCRRHDRPCSTSLISPQIAVTLLAAIAAFATALTVLMPVLSRDRLNTRMQVMAIERDKMRAARLADLAKKDGQGRLRTAPKGFMQEIVDKLNLRSVFDTEEVRDKLKMAGLRGQAPLVTYMFFRVAMPIIIAIVALLYLFVIADYDYPAAGQDRPGRRRRLPRLLRAQHVHPEPGAAAPDLDQERLPRRARHAADLRAVGHVGRGRLRQGVERGRRPVARAGRGAVA